MEPHSKDRSLNFGAFISHVFDIYFPFDREYGGDFDSEQFPMVTGEHAYPDTDHESKSTPSD